MPINTYTPYVKVESQNVLKLSSADLEVQLVQLNHCDGVYSLSLIHI